MGDQVIRKAQDEEPPIILSEDDHHRLSHLVREAVHRYPVDDVELLQRELCRADIVPPEWLPANVIAMNSYVEFRDDGTGKTRRVQLVYPNRADITNDRVSVLSLVGTALIGLMEGESLRWEARDKSSRRLTVLRVSKEPFADAHDKPEARR